MDMIDQPQLWTPALEAAHIQLHWTWPAGWEAHIVQRRAGETWEHRPASVYSDLDAPELFDVLGAELWALLGL